MIVVDNSVLVSLFTDKGPLGQACADRLDRQQLFAPALVDVEALNAVKGLLRGGKISEDLADEVVRGLPFFPMKRVPHEGLVPRIWELRHNFSPYDATYVALAEQLDAVLVTGDERLQRATGKKCVVEVIR
ncbi:type II toxin-antitoxin system VapC family toxin [Streptomyces sp. NA04227]|uniref:type II toxin-antitoxin system VapC family toxin n=1 Tax=Streptomyces sp. NA04227 TaxID=2742136 RepID=UPI001591A202|nr:type II toxin-antitoxin system VapC family toxin [Streptomyces sp. NA04227]QKW07675.1 type II toxin-antitoxin system VapC family toxin [Streptomyces sp. NA04227]